MSTRCAPRSPSARSRTKAWWRSRSSERQWSHTQIRATEVGRGHANRRRFVRPPFGAAAHRLPEASDRLPVGIDLGSLGAPFVAVVDVLPVLEPWAPIGEMDGARRAGGRLFVPALQPVPPLRQCSDFVVGRPLHAMK